MHNRRRGREKVTLFRHAVCHDGHVTRQVQLSQPLLTLLLAALVLGESLTPVMLIAGVGVLACVVATQRARVAVRPARTRAEPAPARLP